MNVNISPKETLSWINEWDPLKSSKAGVVWETELPSGLDFPLCPSQGVACP